MTFSLEDERAALLSDLLIFTKFFFKLRTGREFEISQPVGRQSHYVTVADALMRIFYGETTNLLINIPPGYGKSELLKHFVAWCWAHYPDCNFLYISHTASLAERHTFEIKQIIEIPQYQQLFNIELRRDSKSKSKFHSNYGGAIMAFGSDGAITGQDAGLPFTDRFSGCTLMDDMHKPDEANSKTNQQNIWMNYTQTIMPRRRSQSSEYFVTPQVFIGQRLAEEDLAGYLLKKRDGLNWENLVLDGLDGAENALAPAIQSKEYLLSLKNHESQQVRQMFWAQIQQKPIPPGGELFKRSSFVLLEQEPEILSTFITVDTAETDKTYNDATVFSFWGLYRVQQFNVEMDLYALHWIDCREIRVKPSQLLPEFMQFYSECLRHRVQPQLAIVEKKSTGVTLMSVLEDIHGLNVVNFERLKSKMDRFREIEPYVAAKRVSLLRNAHHMQMCLEHLERITENGAHAHDDICDTLADAVKAALIERMVSSTVVSSKLDDNKAKSVMQSFIKQQHARHNYFRGDGRWN